MDSTTCLSQFLLSSLSYYYFFFFNDPATTEIYTLSLHDALPISVFNPVGGPGDDNPAAVVGKPVQHVLAFRSEEHTSELQSRGHLVCRLLLEKKKKTKTTNIMRTITIYRTTPSQHNPSHTLRSHS